MENGAIYISNQILIKNSNRLGGKISTYVMPYDRSIDIDSIHDFKEAEKIANSKNKYNHENNFIKIAEIGLNHLGSEVIAKKYLNYLINTNVDGISFQIKNEEFTKNLSYY